MKIKTEHLITSFMAVMTLVACQQPGELALNANTAASSSKMDNAPLSEPPADLPLGPVSDIPTTTPVVDPPLLTEPDPNGTLVSPVIDPAAAEQLRFCRRFLENSGQVDLTATHDYSYERKFGNLIVPPAHSASFKYIFAFIEAPSVINVPFINKVITFARVNAQTIGEVHGVLGALCLRADHIGSVSAGAGYDMLVANSIDSIEVVAGSLHIYNATVGEVRNAAGRICLHNGAKILNIGHFRGFIRNDCH